MKRYIYIDLYHGIDALLRFDQTQKQNTTGKSKPKLVSGPIVSHTPKYREAPSFWKCQFL